MRTTSPGARARDRGVDRAAADRARRRSRSSACATSRSDARRARRRDALLDRLGDRRRVLGARVVARHDRDVGARADGLAHRAALRRIAIAAAAEDAEDALALASAAANRIEHARERVGRVRVVDEDDDVVVRAVAALEAARRAGLGRERGGGALDVELERRDDRRSRRGGSRRCARRRGGS